MSDLPSNPKNPSKRALSYEAIAEILLSFEPEQRKFNPSVVVGVARGGLVPASMVATQLSLPLLSVVTNRVDTQVKWLSPPDTFPDPALPPPRALIVDDIASSGGSLKRVAAFLKSQGFETATCTVVHDENRVDNAPDFSLPCQEWILFPWDKKDTTPGTLAQTRKEDGVVHYQMEKEHVVVDEYIAERDKLPKTVARLPKDLNAFYAAKWLMSEGASTVLIHDLSLAVEIARFAPVLDVVWDDGLRRTRLRSHTMIATTQDIACPENGETRHLSSRKFQ